MILTYSLYFKHADVRLNKYKSVRCHSRSRLILGAIFVEWELHLKFLYAALNLTTMVSKILKWRNSDPVVFDLGSLNLDAEWVQNLDQGTLSGVPLYKHSVYTDNARNSVWCNTYFIAAAFLKLIFYLSFYFARVQTIQVGLILRNGYVPEKHHANWTQNSLLKWHISRG